MFVLINGAFGIGKSTVARELGSLLPRSVIFDPEWVGLGLQRSQRIAFKLGRVHTNPESFDNECEAEER